MIFDSLAYAASLPHIGRPRAVEALPFAVLDRPIPGTAHHDVLSTWPYGSPPEPRRLDDALAELRRSGAVSFAGMLKPGSACEPAALPAGMRTVPLKGHYVIDRRRGLPAPSARTRRNLRIARRTWSIDTAPAAEEIARVAGAIHSALQARRRFSDIANVPAAHFPAVLSVPGIAAIAARNGDGIGALMIAAREAGETHLLHLLADDRAIATCPAYLLMAYISETWAQDGPVYLGGAPAGTDGPGIAKFKSRWASAIIPVMMMTAILREDVYRALSPSCAGAGGEHFPAYRQPRRAAA
jgi:hypothetical protein